MDVGHNADFEISARSGQSLDDLASFVRHDVMTGAQIEAMMREHCALVGHEWDLTERGFVCACCSQEGIDPPSFPYPADFAAWRPDPKKPAPYFVLVGVYSYKTLAYIKRDEAEYNYPDRWRLTLILDWRMTPHGSEGRVPVICTPTLRDALTLAVSVLRLTHTYTCPLDPRLGDLEGFAAMEELLRVKAEA